MDTCTGCGSKTRVTGVDEGEGYSEYWGSVKNHVDIQPVSECCGVVVVYIDDRDEQVIQRFVRRFEDSGEYLENRYGQVTDIPGKWD